MIPILACGPIFSLPGLYMSVLILIVFKPLAYYAFIQAFRFRVSRPIPMTTRQAAKLAAVRAGLGAAVAIPLAAFVTGDASLPDELGWVLLYGERAFSWWFVGWKMARIRGGRFIGWLIAGMAINIAFDFAIVFGLMTGFAGPSLVLVLIGLFIAIFHQTGNRDALRLRFDQSPHCLKCQYNLTGNLSGICPECGTPVTFQFAPAPSKSHDSPTTS